MSVPQFLLQGFSLILIDLLLAGDNALVIAMAVRALPTRERHIASSLGAAGAVILRVGLTFAAAQLLYLRFLKLAGGLLILWIAWKVLHDAEAPPEAAPPAARLAQAIWYVIFADLTMSTDNVLAIAGASHGNIGLIVFGLAVSIPFVVMSSNLLAILLNRYPVTVYLGVAILCKVSGDMMLEDPFTVRALHPSETVRYAVDAALIFILLGAGLVRRRRRAKGVC
ncbi:MAG: TerC family protein [Bryobacteraceae bacterium]|jgi:YjbE family integral membrane protein